MTDPRFVLDAALKAQQWERAKGELRALVAVQGAYQTGSSEPLPDRYERLRDRVEAFIDDIEDEALHE